MPDRLVLSPDALRLLRHAEVINDAASQLIADLPPWEQDELLDTIEMHTGAVRRTLAALRS